jgi:hypothetical protein
MPKPNYSFEKRQRELKKQQRKQEKQKRKAELKNASPANTPEATPAASETNQPE